MMLGILQTAHDELHKPGGKPPTLTVSDKLLITLKYYREYVTMESIADDYDCDKSSVCRSIHWVEDVLSADGRFQLPGKKALQEEEPKTVVIDVMEHRIERPKKKQEDWYSGKKKCHTVKSQIIADTETRLIYDVEEAPGSVHDFKLCKETLLMVLILTVMILADSGYQGIQDYHACSLIPIKKSKNRELSEEEKAYNKELSRRRIVIENINAQIKVFKIMSYPYRNRRRRHLLRTKLVCAIINAEKI
jgi:transposase/predicted DNA-binding protein YlxM (UPF0122 family)